MGGAIGIPSPGGGGGGGINAADGREIGITVLCECEVHRKVGM